MIDTRDGAAFLTMIRRFSPARTVGYFGFAPFRRHDVISLTWVIHDADADIDSFAAVIGGYCFSAFSALLHKYHAMMPPCGTRRPSPAECRQAARTSPSSSYICIVPFAAISSFDFHAFYYMFRYLPRILATWAYRRRLKAIHFDAQAT